MALASSETASETTPKRTRIDPRALSSRLVNFIVKPPKCFSEKNRCRRLLFDAGRTSARCQLPFTGEKSQEWRSKIATVCGRGGKPATPPAQGADGVGSTTGYRTDLTVCARFSAVRPKCLKRAPAGADSPKVSIPNTALHPYFHHRAVLPASTATLGMLRGNTASR